MARVNGHAQSPRDPAGLTPTIGSTRWYAVSYHRRFRTAAPLRRKPAWLRPQWFVPLDRDAESLGEEGVSRGRIWTARELIALMALPDVTAAIAGRLTLAKRAGDGDIVEVRPWSQGV